jgi:4-hydroxyphenylpyruvate dioxygenase
VLVGVPDAVDDDGRIAEQLHVLAERAAARGVRVSYEALAWGRHVNTYDRSWEIVRRADHPALGLCVDSFHILSRGSDPAGIRDIPGEKLFFLQLADAPHMDMNVLQWSRHHRLFPGQGAFDLPAFLGHVLVAGYTGPLSLEVFNDVFRQADPRRAAVDALRSLLALDEAVHDHLADDPAWRARRRPRRSSTAGSGRCPTPRSCTVSRSPRSRSTTSASPRSRARSPALGFRPRRHPSHQAASQLWSPRAGTRAAQRPADPATAPPLRRVGVEVDDPPAAAQRGDGDCSHRAPPHPRSGRGGPVGRRRAGRDLGVLLPHGCRGRVAHRLPRRRRRRRVRARSSHIDHVALTQPFDNFDEAALFYRSLLGSATPARVGGRGPVRPGAQPDGRRPAADAATRAERVRAAPRRVGARASRSPSTSRSPAPTCSRRPARPARPARRCCRSRTTTTTTSTPGWPRRRSSSPPCASCGVLLDRDGHGEFLHFYTEVLGGRVFFEVGAADRRVTRATARSTPRSGWPRTAGCALR